MKLLHTADWQIGKRYGQFDPEEAALLAEARFDVVSRIAELANSQGVDLVLVAGDVFDAQGVSDRTVLRLFQLISGFAGPWVMIPGNHDAGLAESVWTRAARLGAIPPNAHVCLRAEPLTLSDPGVVILPAPLTQRHTYEDLTHWFDSVTTPVGVPRIGLAHGSVQGILAEDIDAANPIAPERSALARLDYLALGDWHGTKQIGDRTWYSGTPETDRFRNNDSGQVLLVELAAPGAVPTVTPITTGRYRWRYIERELQLASDVFELVRELETFDTNDVVQLKLSGHVDLESHLSMSRAVGQTQARTRSLLVDLSGLRIQPTDDDIRALHADGYLGEVIADLRAQEGDENAELARDALALLAGILDETRATSANGGQQ
ncbi:MULTISPECIES: metallophosphoesterase family protein [Burkholderia]|uniref:metallophosphoesterase family protein n=1 Tax=Burkholderia TaxID=32008 RepID=UPI000978CC08|nr:MULTISPECIES: DNA repair exonuclease [Burkholderia]MCM2549246.1 DNA repair exonuclease [Burkholderia glumae]OMQ93639.1 metallophosphatase [Burkholderia pseudomallei]VBL42658.1 metallophosphoesterase [Burkholderia pseudomallei]